MEPAHGLVTDHDVADDVIAAVSDVHGAGRVGEHGQAVVLLPGLGRVDLEEAVLSNTDLLDAVRSLATIEDRGALRVVDYRNLGSEELGSIYESLLELHPELDTESGEFELKTVAGHERKTTGSYYTPSSLISVLLDSALDPVLDEAATKPTKEEAERAILDLSVVDPAAGSGHFLVAAAHRIARRLASVRTEDDEPSPEAIRTSLRDVIGHCLYAVDINPMAVELCKVSLWLEAIEPGKPLSFLDAHVKCGNSLLGTTPDLMAAGIPDAAFEPIEGDDKAVAASLKKRNRAEREGQLAIGESSLRRLDGELGGRTSALDNLADSTVDAVRTKEREYGAILQSPEYREAKLLADAWCASFVVQKADGKPEITTSTLRRLSRDGLGTDPELTEAVSRLARQYLFFHWETEFPEVLARGDGRGFDVVLANPPWERIKLQEQEFFAERSPIIAGAPNAAARKKLIAALDGNDPALWAQWKAALRQSDGESKLVRDSGRYPLGGRGDVNTYVVFAELMRTVLSPTGRVGVILPTGIATDDTTKLLFRDLVDKRELASLYGFENEEKVFPNVHNEFKFCLLTLVGAARPVPLSDFVFFARQVGDLAEDARHFALTTEEFALLNPNTRTCPIFRSRRDAEITKAIYGRIPVLVNDSEGAAGSPWGLSFARMFDMANSSALFRTQGQLEADGWHLEGNSFRRGDAWYLPLYEGKMVHQFDHRFGTYEGQTQAQANKGFLPYLSDGDHADGTRLPLPGYWVPEAEVSARLADRWDRRWLIGWRDITNAVVSRTIIASSIPRVAVGDTLLLALPSTQIPLSGGLLANLNSFVLDYAARQKIGGIHAKYHVIKQLPILPPDAYLRIAPWSPVTPVAAWITPRVVELASTSYDVQAFAQDHGWSGSPFRWDPERRSQIRAELDAAFFHCYGLVRDDVDYILDTFPVLRRSEEKSFGEFRSKRRILDAYDAMADAITSGIEYQTLLDPPPGDPRAAHALGPGEETGRWIEAPEDAVQPVSPSRPLRGEGVQRSRSAPQLFVSDSDAPSWLASSSTASDDGWISEGAVDPSSVQAGEQVRHKRFGPGQVVWVRVNGRSTTLVIRFDDGDRDIMFGLGLLDFARTSGS